MAAEGVLAAWVSPCVQQGVFLLLLFLPWRAASREAAPGAQAPVSLTELDCFREGRSVTPQLGLYPAELTPGTKGTCFGSRAGLTAAPGTAQHPQQS